MPCRAGRGGAPTASLGVLIAFRDMASPSDVDNTLDVDVHIRSGA